MSAPDRGEMLDRADKALSIRRQCALLCVARSGVYRAKRPANDNDLILMRRIDELFMAYPFYGSRRMTVQLRSEGHDINRKRVQRIMRTMGIVALGPKPNTSKPAPGHKIYPYLLRGLKIERPNHVWCADITYIPIGRGFLYLVALMDWATINLKRSTLHPHEGQPDRPNTPSDPVNLGSIRPISPRISVFGNCWNIDEISVGYAEPARSWLHISK